MEVKQKYYFIVRYKNTLNKIINLLYKFNHVHIIILLPSNMKLLVAVDGLLFDTVHSYSPSGLPVTITVWVYFPVIGSFNTVFPPTSCAEFLVQVTLVAGPPVEIQVRINCIGPLGLKFISSGMTTSPI